MSLPTCSIKELPMITGSKSADGPYSFISQFNTADFGMIEKMVKLSVHMSSNSRFH